MQLRFSDCLLDTEKLLLSRAGSKVPVEPQVFDLLALFARNPGRVISKDELIETVWQGRIVSDATISARINAARTAVGDSGAEQRIIRTVPRRGFEFCADVKESDKFDATAPAPQRQRIKYTKSPDGTRLAYAQSGSGAPVLRLSHHLSHLERDWNSRLWRPFFERLGAEYTLHRYDIRGTGLSDADLEGATIEDYIADLTAVADAAGLDEFAMVTHLQSTPVALRFIAENPGRVTRLVVQEGYVRGRALRIGAPDTPDADPVIALIRNGWGDPRNGFMRAWMAMIMPSAGPEDVDEMIELISGVAAPDSIVTARRIIDKFTAEDVLDKIDLPTLIIHARNDTIHPVDEARELAMGIEGAELLIVDSNSTLCIPSDPTWDEQVSAMMEFLAEG